MTPIVCRAALLALGLALPAGAQEAPFGRTADVDYADRLWDAMTEMGLAGPGAIQATPYEGEQPHGLWLETLYATARIDDHSGTLIVKRNYGPDATADRVLAAPDAHLAAVTIMFRRAEGYDAENLDWFYAKYLPDGTLDRNPADIPLAGRVGKGGDAGCIACHSAAEGYTFTTNAFTAD